MLRHIFRYTLLVLALLAAALPAAAQSDTGDANFARYVAVGDSLTAGVSSGGLARSVQVSSYPLLIFRQVTGSANGFEQPLVSDPGVPGTLQLVSLAPLVIAPRPGTGQPLNLNLQRPYNNLGVPGARVCQITSTTTGGAFDLVLRNPAFGNTTALQQAASLNPTFATVWIGNNDVLAAALSGRVIEGVTITPVADFQACYRAIITTLAGRGADLALANIPDVTSIPFVTTIPPFVVNPQTQQPVLINGQPVPLIGPNGLLGAGDRVLLTAQSELAVGRGIPAALGGSGLPLSDAVVLSSDELSIISSRVAAYNQFIAAIAGEVDAALVDVNTQLRELATHGISIGGITYTSAFLTGGVFSYDGVHPTSFGYAYIANLFIGAINEEFNADIEPVDLVPFVFGPPDVAAVQGGAPVSSGADALLSAAAVRNLFWVLGVPDLQQQEPAKPGKKPNRGRRGKPGRR